MPVATNIAVGNQPVPAKQESLEGIIAACQEAKSQFRPLTKEDLKSVKAELVETLSRLDTQLKAAGANGEDWQKFLLWETLQKELQKEGALDQKALNDVSSRYASGNEGLGLIWFVEVRSALWRLLKVDEAIDNPKTKITYERMLDNLSNNLKSFAVKPTTENTLGISESIRWLQNLQQAPELVQAVQRQFNQPNLYGEASAEFIAASMAESVDDNTDICDEILGTSISGTGHTVGQTTAELSPDANLGVIDALLFATAYSTTVGSHGPVCIYTTGTTHIGACKRIWINEYGFFSYPAVSNAVTQTCINDIQAKRKIIERIAWKKAYQQKPTAECIASLHAQQRANKRVDDKAAETLDKAQEDFMNKFRRPLCDHKLFPDQLRFSTDKQALQTVSLQIGSSRLAASTPPPSAIKADLVLRVHESMINNFALDALGGMTVNEDNFQKAMNDMFPKLSEETKPDGNQQNPTEAQKPKRLSLRDKMKRDKDQPPWTITFATRQPISVTFSDEGYKIIIRGTKFINGDNSCDDMDITVVYKFEKTDAGFKAVRQGEIQIFPPGRHQLGGKEIAIKKLLTKRFSKIFEPEIVGEGFEFSGKLKKVGEMLPEDVKSSDGWLTIAWKRAQADKKLN
ncbi:MAG: hypothetical protein ABSA26_02290 [Thermoguttaceae bacterium]